MQARGTKTGRMGRELRGGSWNNNSNNLDASNRNNNDPTNENNNNGFRVARPPAFFSKEQERPYPTGGEIHGDGRKFPWPGRIGDPPRVWSISGIRPRWSKTTAGPGAVSSRAERRLRDPTYGGGCRWFPGGAGGWRVGRRR